jgi:hypothetical protein
MESQASSPTLRGTSRNFAIDSTLGVLVHFRGDANEVDLVHEILGIKTSEFTNIEITVDRAADFMKKYFPDLWKLVYTKQIDAPSTHYNFKAPAVALATAMQISRLARSKPPQLAMVDGRPTLVQPRTPLGSGLNYLIAQDLLSRYDYPTFYVSENLMNALLHTQPPQGYTWADVPFPFPAQVIMLPRNTFREPSGQAINFVIVGIIEAGTESRKLANGETVKPPESDRIIICWAADGGFTIHAVVFPRTDPLEPSSSWIEEKTKEYAGRMDIPNYEGPPAEFSSYVAGLVANMLLVKSVRPELTEGGERIGSIPNKVTGTTLGVYRPIFIGRNYAIERKPTTEHAPTGAHYTELRWRSGHFKDQAHGIRRSERKIIWINPYLCYGAGLVKVAGS